MRAAVVGRAPELDAIVGLLDDTEPTARALLVEGEAGIGKTALWREGVRLARERGFTVLSASPAESESSLP